MEQAADNLASQVNRIVSQARRNSTATRTPSHSAREISRDLAMRRPAEAAKAAGIPAKYQNAKLSDFNAFGQSRVGKTMAGEKESKGGPYPSEIEGIASVGDGLFLSGAAGIGKTHYAAAWSIANLHTLASGAGYDFKWIRSPDLLMDIRSTYNGRGNEIDIVKRYRHVGLLVIDDLGAEKMTDWSVSALYSILAGRIDDCRPTVVTSNLGLKEIDAWEPRIASRLAAFSTVKFPHVDRRLKINAISRQG